MSGGGNALPFRLLAITPGVYAGLPDAVAAAAEAGGAGLAVLLRAPGLPLDALRRSAQMLLPFCRAAGSLLLVHGDPNIVRDVGADGAHLPDGGPERGMEIADARAVLGPGPLLGVSRHDAAGLAAGAGADYATLSPVFATPGKGAPLGLPRFAVLCRAAPLPVVALGGITPERAPECRAAGAVAAIRAVWDGDPARNVRLLLASLPSPSPGSS